MCGPRPSNVLRHTTRRRRLPTVPEDAQAALTFGGDLVDAALERIVKSQRLAVRERQKLHHDRTGDAPGRVEPIVGIVDAAPAQAAGGALAGDRIGRDKEGEAPLVATVGDEREIFAAWKH